MGRGHARRWRRLTPWLASAAAHAGLIALVLRLPVEGTVRRADDGTPAIELLDIELPPAPLAPEPEVGPGSVPTTAGRRGGGAPPVVRAAPRRSRPPAAPAPADAVASATLHAAAGGPAPTRTPPAAGPTMTMAGGGLLGTGVGAGAGSGAGSGRGTGSGRAGAGSGGSERAVARATRPAPRRSRARPPRLIYPRRDREEVPGRVFIARLTIDEDGYVVGVRMVQRVDPFVDEKAATAVWRFRYSPALDDAGRPIKVKYDQRFMLE